MEEKLDKIIELVVGMNQEIVGIRGEIVGMKGEIAEIKGEITGMKGEIAEIKGEITGMKGEIAEIKGELVNLNERVERIENKLGLTFDTVGVLKEEAYEIKLQQERHEMLFGEIAKSLLEHNARFRQNKIG